MVFTVQTASVAIPCENCGTKIAVWANDQFRVRVKKQWVVTSRPVSISCGKCEYINDFTLTESETSP